MATSRAPPHCLEGKDHTWEFVALDEMVAFILEEGQKGITSSASKAWGR